MPSLALAHDLLPAAPRPAGEHRPWFEGTRGMVPSWGGEPVVDIDLFRRRLAEAEASREVVWTFEPHAGQRLVLEAGERFLAAACGRRWGKTYSALRWIVDRAGESRGLTWWVAPTYATGMRAWADCIALLPRRFRRVLKGERAIELSGGGRIEFKSADNPDALRGAGLAAVVVDEAAYVSDYVWQDVLAPMLMTTLGRLLAISTPRAKKGWFYQLWRDGQAGAAEHQSWQFPTSSNEAVPHIAEEVERLRESMPTDAFRREILAEFLDEVAAVFEGVRELATLKASPPGPGEYVIGIDWGRRQDFTVVVVLRSLGDGRAEMVHLERFTGLRFAAQLARVRALFGAWKPQRILAEENSMGGPLVEALQDEGWPVEAFNTNSATKPALIQQLRLAFTTEALRLLADPVLIGELEDYEQDFSATGRPTFSAPERQHDDCVIATALAWRGVAGEPGGDGRGEGFKGDLEEFLIRGSEAPRPFVKRDGVWLPAGAELRRAA